LSVAALCSRDVGKASARAEQFYPDALVFADHRELLALDSVQVVDIATHPEGRAELIADSIAAGKHVLSQKPFALNLSVAEELIAQADLAGVKLAINQNGRWAPHLAAMRELIAGGVIGSVTEVDASVRWDHSWTVGTSFDQTPFLVLFDFGVHWFDFISTVILGRQVSGVSASVSFTPQQRSPQPMKAEVLMTGPGISVRLAFDGDSANLQRDVTVIKGEAGALVSEGVDLQSQELTVHAAGATAPVPLDGDWFTTGFEGAMCELLCAIQEGREPSHSASANLRTLELAFAACESANTGLQVRPGSVRELPNPSCR
jgi:predicted dehydrogenase